MLGRAHVDNDGVEGQEDDQAMRCEFAFPRADTRCLLLLLVRWCSANKQTGRIEHVAGAAKMLLDAFFNQITCNLQVAGIGPLETTDTAVNGSRMVLFAVHQGKVDLKDARVTGGDDVRRNCGGFGDGVQKRTLLELLLSAPCMRIRLSDDFGFLAQFAWILGPMTEKTVFQVASQSGNEEKPWWRRSSLQFDHGLSSWERAPFAFAYSEASAARAKLLEVLSIAVDDSRIGRQPWKLGALLDPKGNFVFWLLPQARGGQTEKH